MLIPLIQSVPFVTDDDDTGIVVLSGEFTATEFCALIREAVDIEWTTWKMTWTTTAAEAAAAQMPQRRG